jgi:hypothetical protein
MISPVAGRALNKKGTVMITSWDIYWITRLDSINVVAGFAVFILGIIILFGIGFYRELKDEYELFSVWVGVAATIFFLSLLCTIFTPSTKEAAAIYLIPKIANNEQMQKIPDNAAKLLNAKMEQWIDDTLAEKKKEKE